MTNKLEIGRELAEVFAGPRNYTPKQMRDAMDELRALLAKSDDADKVNNRQMGLMQFVEKHAAPVVERQEPVAWMRTSACTTVPRFSINPPTQYEIAFARGHAGQFTPLYTQRPAPVAVVRHTMRSVMEAVGGLPGLTLTSNQCAALADRLNASLDKELNQ